MLRQYASEKLTSTEEADTTAQSGHAGYFVQYLSAREEQIQGNDQKTVLDEISVEMENIRVAWNWLSDNCDYEAIAACLESLFLFYEIRSQFIEGELAFRQAHQALSQCPQAGEIILNRLGARRGG